MSSIMMSTLIARRLRRGGICLASLSLAMVTLIAVAPPAAAQSADVQALQQRIDRLESDLAILQRQVYLNGGNASAAPSAGGGQVAPTEAASLETRVSQLESEMQSLTGRIEELGHNVDLLKSQLDKLSKDVDFRLTALEHGGTPPGGGPAASAAPEGAATAPSAPAGGGAPLPSQKPVAGAGQVLPVGTPQQQYDYARALLVQQDYANAEKAFSAFVTSHPDDALAGPAQYWLGETYYVRGNYEQAAKTFAEGYQRYPKSSKAPDSLLKLAMSLVQLKRNKDACVLFNELNQRYPHAPANVKQLAGRERQRAGCG
ncbi:MAG TPA: tol-pal system protein YbgF [Alphaproteobacteria bacterium]|nr:tol-pal system protein YbgF [Alphaproteobacteria bacterium]